MKVEYVNPFVQATFDVLSAFGTSNPKVGKPSILGDSFISDGVAVVIGVIGKIKGQVMYVYTEETAKQIASMMMMGMPVKIFDEMAKSAISELANMISGNASTVLAGNGFIIDIAPPTLLIGENMKITTSVKKNLIIPIATLVGIVKIVISLE